MSCPSSKKSKEEDLGNYLIVSLTVVPGKVIEHIFTEANYRHFKGKKALGNK